MWLLLTRLVQRLLLGVTLLSVSPLEGRPWHAQHGLSSAEFRRQETQWSGRGYRLTDVSLYAAGKTVRYAAIWKKEAGPAQVTRFGLAAVEFQREMDRLAAGGYGLVRVSAAGIGPHAWFAGIWEKRGGPAAVVRYNLTSSDYQRELDNHAARGYRPAWISGYALGGEARYVAIWQHGRGPAWRSGCQLTPAGYQREFDQWTRQGYRLTCVSGFTVAGQDLYAAVWEKTGGPGWVARHGIPAAEYQAVCDDFFYQGYVPRQVSGYAGDGRGRWAAIWESRGLADADLQRIDAPVGRFLARYNVPGLSLAVAKNGRLVFAKGYGYADKERQAPVHTSHLFRIASMSKPITSVAIFTLIERGKLSLADKVFGPRGVLGDRYGLPQDFPQKGDVTVEQLLEHSGGGWPNDGSDPMFRRYDLGQAELIRWTLPRYALPNRPGEKFAYSNFGYLLLGRVIEARSGKPYEEYVRQAVLRPAGITDMHVAGDTLAQRRPNEVVYYDDGDAPYTVRVSRMDSHGGWIARPVDLVRFLVRVDGFPTKPDLLTPASIAEMTSVSKANKGYAKGWSVNTAHNWWHNGSLPGTYSIFVRAQNGFCWAILMNQRRSEDGFARDVDQLGWTVTRAVGSWPAYDLF
jgi:CubicO group peptidase (beta-lactamase class C family)